jgi:plastocyanin
VRGVSRMVCLLIGLGLMAAACSSGDDVVSSGLVDPGQAEVDADASCPDGTPALPTGSIGFSRYVYADIGDEVLPFLLEGPNGDQVRCQDIELPCSYLDLKDLAASGEPIPGDLAMTGDELEALVEQLDTLSAVLTGLETIDEACAAGYRPYTTQWPNMGVHLRNAEHTADRVMDPARPDVVMFARPDGETVGLDELGTCDGDDWTGSDGMEVVGAAFYLPIAKDHPDGWAGPIDNWHIHHNSCGGSQISGVTPVSAEDCEADGGTLFSVDPQWMIHAYAVPEYDNQLGVFSMWNPAVSPVVATEDIEASRAQLEVEGAVTWSINDFRLGDLAADVGQPIVFANSDATPHTVTAADGALFDSGAFGTGGAYTVSFDQPGDYAYFCSIHPSMTGTITVD